MGQRWHVVQVWPGREYKIRDEIEKRAFEVFLPELRETRVYRRTRTTYRHIGPLFPLYVFVRFGSDEPWRWIDELVGVSGVIVRDERPVAVQPGRVESLLAKASRIVEGERTRYVLRERDLIDKPKSKFRAKQRLMIADGGIFDGHVARYVAGAEGEVTLELDFLGRNVRLKVSEALVTAA